MTVYFIGAGPGAPDLLTQRAIRLISRCGTTLYTGSILPRDVLSYCPPTARTVDTARMSLSEILDELRAAHGRGDDVARLHSGDPSVYSAVDEQIRVLAEEQIPYEIVPGVPAFAAAAASLGQELTVPGVAQSVLLTRVDGRSTPMPPGEDLATVCASGGTAVVHLAAAQLDRVVTELSPVYGPDCPAAIVAFASRPSEIVIRGRLDEIPSLAAEAEITRTAVVVVGHVLGDHDQARSLLASAAERSFLYSDDRPRDALGRTLPEGQEATDETPDTSDAQATDEKAADEPPSTSPASGPPGPILILGGTTEGRHLADLLDSAGLDVVTSLAGRVSRPRLPRGEVRVGGFGGADGLARWVSEHEISAIIDATHPYAEKISLSAITASENTETPMLRLHREAWRPGEEDHWIHVSSMAEAATVVREQFGRPMLTIGRLGLDSFADDSRGSYLIRCVEPPTGDLPTNYLLVLDRGPFGIEEERALMSRHRIDVLVTKNSGGTATVPKLAAARELRIPVIVIDRPSAPQVDTVHTVEDAARWIVRRFGRGDAE